MQVVLFQTNRRLLLAEYSRLPNAKYKNEIFGIQGYNYYTEAANLPSQISEIQAAKRQISEKGIEERKSLVDKANKTSELMDRVRALLFAVYLVLGAAVGTLLSEIGKDISQHNNFL